MVSTVLYAVGWSSGELWRVDPESGAAEVIATLDPPLDNLAIGPDDSIYVSQPARSAIVRVDAKTGEQSDVVPGNLSMPGGVAITMHGDRETLVVVSLTSYQMSPVSVSSVASSIGPPSRSSGTRSAATGPAAPRRTHRIAAAGAASSHATPKIAELLLFTTRPAI